MSDEEAQEEVQQEQEQQNNENEADNAAEQTVTEDASVDSRTPPKGLSVEWVFGMNKEKSLTGCVHNLGDKYRKDIFYVSGHIGIIYNFEKHQQELLQGHIHPITSTCVSKDKRWIVTADSGKENMIIIWDSIKAIPVKTLFSPFEGAGVTAVDISQDNLYLVALSEINPHTNKQKISVWEWTSSSPNPIVTTEISSEDAQISLQFHFSSSRYIATNGKTSVMFWSWEKVKDQDGIETEDYQFVSFAPGVSTNDLKKEIGHFTKTIFIPNTHMAVTGTEDGDLVLWQNEFSKQNETSEIRKTVLKVVKVHNSAVRVLIAEGKYVITGGADGYVRFFDHQLRIEAWFESFDAGPISSISFEKATFEEFQEQQYSAFGSPLISDAASVTSSRLGDTNKDKQGEETTLKCPNFIISTAFAMIIYVEKDAFHLFDEEKLRGHDLVHGQKGDINCLAMHPKQPILAISGNSGHIHFWDYEKKEIRSISVLNELDVVCIAFDPKGELFLVGCASGIIKLFKFGNSVSSTNAQIPENQAFSLKELNTFKLKSPPLRVAFSHDSLFFAHFDKENAVGLFKWGHRDDDERKPIEWVYVGRCKAHRTNVTELRFGVVPYGDVARLMSIGEDRRLVEYDLQESTMSTGLKIRSVHKIGQSAKPTAYLWISQQSISPKYFNEKQEYDFMFFATDEYKFHQFTTPDHVNADSSKVSRCTKTFITPTYGGPITKMILLPPTSNNKSSIDEENEQENEQTNPDIVETTSNNEEDGQDKPAAKPKKDSSILAYSTDQRIIGLIRLEIDGNPAKTMGLIAHSCEIKDFVCSPDGQFLFTAGGSDGTVVQWRVNASAFEKETAKENVDELKPFVDIIKYSTSDGEQVWEELQQYFYYAQVRSQGEITTTERKIIGKIPLSQIPSVLRGIGFYCSKYEEENLINELRLMLPESDNTDAEIASVFDEDELFVNFDTFVRIYVNHRPVKRPSLDDFRVAFERLNKKAGSVVLNKKQFLTSMKEEGERLTEKEIDQYINQLLGDGSFDDWISFNYQEFCNSILKLKKENLEEKKDEEDDQEDEEIEEEDTQPLEDDENEEN